MNPIEQAVDGTKRLLGFRLLEFSQRIGFSTQTNQDTKDPSERLLADMLRSLPKEIFNVNGTIPETLSIPFKEYLSNVTLIANNTFKPSLTTVGIGESLSERCGRRSSDLFDDEDRLHLFLRKMHAPLSDFPRDGYDLNSFYVKRSIYLAFFGATVVREAESQTDDEAQNADSSVPTDDDAQHTGASAPTGQASAAGMPTNQESGSSDQTPLENQGNTDPQPQTEPQPQNNSQESVIFVSRIEGIVATICLFNRERVNKCARRFAVNGNSLMTEQGIYIIYSQCYDVLFKSNSRKIIVQPKLLEEVRREHEELQEELQKQRQDKEKRQEKLQKERQEEAQRHLRRTKPTYEHNHELLHKRRESTL
ncbi:hypothetical protein V496_00162 [Pseudogymnoascus sp. VKM F-4515 (FW-2607)]|nr:hypothetical protein V496_00162 [Pseudogymnoascus sp. VKM F-4515 (FW-2607)]